MNVLYNLYFIERKSRNAKINKTVDTYKHLSMVNLNLQDTWNVTSASSLLVPLHNNLNFYYCHKKDSMFHYLDPHRTYWMLLPQSSLQSIFHIHQLLQML